MIPLADPDAPRRRVVLLQTQAEAAGAQEISRLLARELAGRGHDVYQLFFFRRTAAFDGDAQVVFCARERPSNPLALARMLLRLRAELRRLRPATVICFQHFGNLIGAPIARLAGVRHVIANHNGMQDLLSPWVVGLDRWAGLAGAYSSMVVNSEATAAEYGGYPERYRRRLVRIDHGFQDKTSRLGKAEARASFGLPAAGVLLGSVARLAPKKNLAAAIRLLPERPGWHLALAGQGPARPDLQALAEELGCADRLHFAGELSPARVGDFLAALDVFVFPSLTETFGLAAVEAAQAGVPVVANALPVMEEILSHAGEPCALFVDADDPRAFAGAIGRVLADPGLAAALSARGRRLRDRYPLDAMVDGYDALIRTAA